MAKRGESAGPESDKTPAATRKKLDRKALAEAETARRAARGAGVANAPEGATAQPSVAKESAPKIATSKPPKEAAPVTTAETAAAADTATPASTVAQTVDAERERAVAAAFEKAKASFDGALQTGEGFRLKGTIATSIGTLRKKHGTEAVDDLLQRLEQAGVRDIDILKTGEGESGQGEVKIEDIGTLDNGLKPGEEFIGLNLHYDNEKGTWAIIERKKSDQSEEEIQQEAASAYQDVVSAVQWSLGFDYFEDGEQRKLFIDRMEQLKKELSAMRVNLAIDRSGTKITTAIEGREWSEEISKRKNVGPSMVQKAKTQMRKDIISFLTESIISELQGSLANKMGDYKAKAKSAEWQDFQTGYGQTEGGNTTIILKGAVKIGDHTIQLGNEREYAIEGLANIMGKRSSELSGDDIIAYAKAKVLAELATTDSQLAVAIKALPTNQKPETQRYDSEGTVPSFRPGQRGGAERGGRTGAGKSNADREQGESHRAGRQEGGAKGAATVRRSSEGSSGDIPPRQPAAVRAKTSAEQALETPPYELSSEELQKRIDALSLKISELQKDLTKIEDSERPPKETKGTPVMAEFAERQNALRQERLYPLQDELWRLQRVLEMKTRKAEEQPAGGVVMRPAGEMPVKGGAAASQEAAPTPAGIGASPAPESPAPPTPGEPAPKPTDTKPPVETPQIDGNTRSELVEQLTEAERDRAASNKKLADLKQRAANAEGKKKQPQKQITRQIEYEQGKLNRLEQKIAGIRKQLEEGQQVTAQEKEAEERRGLPIFIHQGLRIIAESVATARILADKLQSYEHEKVGAARMEAIDNAIEIINAAEKERAQIAARFATTTDIDTLRNLVGQSSNMALQSADAVQRLKAFEKEMATEELKKPESVTIDAELDAKINAVQIKIEHLTKTLGALQESVDHANKTLREIGRDDGKRRSLLEELGQLTATVQKKAAELHGNKTLLAKLTKQQTELSSVPAASMAEQPTEEPETGELSVEIPETIKAMTEPQLRETIDAMMMQLANHYSAGHALADLLPADKSSRGRRLIEELKNNADLGSVWADLIKGETPTHDDLLGIYGNSSARLSESQAALAALRNLVSGQGADAPHGPYRPPLKAGAEPVYPPAQQIDAATAFEMPAGTFDLGGFGQTEGGAEEEKSALAQLEQIGIRLMGNSTYQDYLIVYLEIPSPDFAHMEQARIAVSQYEIVRLLPSDLASKVDEHESLWWEDMTPEERDTIGGVEGECAARKMLARIQAQEAGTLEPPDPTSALLLEEENTTIEALKRQADDLFDMDVMSDLELLRSIPLQNETLREQFVELDSNVADNISSFDHWYRMNSIANAERYTDIETKILLAREYRKLLEFRLQEREQLCAEIKRMANAEKETMPFLQDTGSGARGPARVPTAEQLRAAHWRVPRAGAQPMEPAGPLLGGREPLQIGAGAETPLTPDQLEKVAQIDRQIGEIEERMAKRADQIRWIQEQIELLRNKPKEE